MRRFAAVLVLLMAGCSSGTVGSTGTGSASSGSGSASGASSGSGGSGSSTGGSGSTGTGDTYLPWEGGPAYYAQWAHGPSSAADFFPIAVWLQSPGNASRYAAVGINTFVGLWQGPTDQQVADLDAAGMPAICDQAVDWANHTDDANLLGWQQQDEPDNAQSDGQGGYGPCVDPSAVQQVAATFKANDSTRPVYLNLGQGAAWADYYGRGSACAGVDDYADYAVGSDILSFDIYPVNSTDPETSGKLEYVARGVDHLRQATNFQKPVWTWIETTGFNDPSHTPTPAQIRTEVWMALIHGARGIGYFAHIFSPSFVEAGLLSVPASKAAVEQIDAQVSALAPVLNEPPLANGATVSSSDASVPVDILVKRHDGKLYVFAAAMRDGPTDATFTVRSPSEATIEVLGESRSLALSGGSFTDHFDGYGVHLYEISP